jgi:hypothetical protein
MMKSPVPQKKPAQVMPDAAPAPAAKQPNPTAVAAVSKTPAKAYGLTGTKPVKPAKRQVALQRKPAKPVAGY